jgi:hypothetical protein
MIMGNHNVSDSTGRQNYIAGRHRRRHFIYARHPAHRRCRIGKIVLPA